MAQKVVWSPVEDAYLIDNYATGSVEALAKNLAKSVSAVRTRASVLGLTNGKRKTGASLVNTTPGFKGGFKPHLGVSVRSGWENNVLLWLNKKRIKWEYEPQVFYFNEIKRGTRAYTPDIWLPNKNTWIEVKGYMGAKDQTKIKRFKKYYPEEFAKLTAITKNANVDATKVFKDLGVPIYAYYDDIKAQYSNLPNWIQ